MVKKKKLQEQKCINSIISHSIYFTYLCVIFMFGLFINVPKISWATQYLMWLGPAMYQTLVTNDSNINSQFKRWW